MTRTFSRRFPLRCFDWPCQFFQWCRWLTPPTTQQLRTCDTGNNSLSIVRRWRQGRKQRCVISTEPADLSKLMTAVTLSFDTDDVDRRRTFWIFLFSFLFFSYFPPSALFFFLLCPPGAVSRRKLVYYGHHCLWVD